MSTNINNKSSLVNNSNEEFSYFSLNKRVYRELKLNQTKNKIKTDDYYFLMSHLASEYITYKNGLVGVYNKLTQYQLADELKINSGRISGYLKKLEEMKFIKIFNLSPLVLQVLEIPKAPRINDIKSLLLFVSANPQDFHFHLNLDNRKAFFEIFKQYETEVIKENIKKAIVPKTYKPKENDELNDPFGDAEYTS